MKLETKFNIEEIIWFIYENKAKEVKIEDITVTVDKTKTTKIKYTVNTGTKESSQWCFIEEKYAYFTREELINNL